MFKHACTAAAIAIAAIAAHAPSQPKPDVPAATAPPAARSSAYGGYRPYRDEALAPWREVNDEVGRVGGFTVVKVRDGLARGDYRDPGWYKHPPGTVAYEWTGAPQPLARAATPGADPQAMTVKKGGGHAYH